MRSARESGASAVEFALIVPLVVMLLFGTSRRRWPTPTTCRVTNATREGARYGAARTRRCLGDAGRLGPDPGPAGLLQRCRYRSDRQPGVRQARPGRRHRRRFRLGNGMRDRASLPTMSTWQLRRARVDDQAGGHPARRLSRPPPHPEGAVGGLLRENDGHDVHRQVMLRGCACDRRRDERGAIAITVAACMTALVRGGGDDPRLRAGSGRPPDRPVGGRLRDAGWSPCTHLQG